MKFKAQTTIDHNFVKTLLGVKEIPSLVTLTLSWHSLIMRCAYHLTKATFDQSLMTILPRVKEILREHEMSGSIP